MKNIAIIDQSVTNEEGDVIKRFVFTEDSRDTTAITARYVKFEPVAQYKRILKVKQQDNQWRVEGETIYFQMSDVWAKGPERGPIPDTLGGDALGRKFGKEAKSLPADVLEKMKQELKWYNFLFGRFTFLDKDGKTPLSTVIGNLRLTGGQGVDFDALKIEPEVYADTVIKLSAAVATQGMRRFNLKFEQSTVKTNPDFAAIRAEVQEFIDAENAKVLDKYNEAQKNKKVGEKLNEGGMQVGGTDLNDEVPF